MKKDLKQILPYYLNSGLKAISNGEIFQVVGVADKSMLFDWDDYDGFSTCWYKWDDDNFKNTKILLRPLSQLTEPITHEGETFVPIEKLELANKAKMKGVGRYDFEDINKYGVVFNSLPFWIIQKLIEWKFNVFNLPEDQFIDVTTLKENCYE